MMYCDVNNDKYNPYTENRMPSFVQIHPGMISDMSVTHYTETDLTYDTIYFVLVMSYLILPMLYIILTTGNPNIIMLLWSFIQTGIFDALQGVKQFLTNTVIYTMRVFGYYTFSTYTVVKDGRELFSSRSDYFYMKSTRDNIKRIDPAKYRICKWIDNECRLYQSINNGEEPELTESHNDIYDFILHTFDSETHARIHRGDFRISTHTSLVNNYRKFCKSYQFCDTVELRVSVADLNEGSHATATSTSTASASATEVIFIDMKRPFNFYIEKNVLLDKKFLRWYLYSQLGRKDLANYVGLPYSKYSLNMYYNDFMKDVGVTVKPNPSERLLSALAGVAGVAGDETKAAAVSQRIRAFTVNDNQFILIGNRYMVKVDAILGCPVFESSDKDVLQIEDVLTNYYDDSVVGSDTDDEDDGDADQVDDADQDDDNDDDDDDQEDDESAVTDYMTDTDVQDTDVIDTTATVNEIETKTESPDTEFELIDPSID